MIKVVGLWICFCSYFCNKYSFRKKLGLHLASIYSWCLLNKPLHISKADTKISIAGFQARVRGGGFHSIPWFKYNSNAIKSEVIHSFVPCYAFCYLVIPTAILQYFIWLLTTSMLTASRFCMRIVLWTLTTSMPTALIAYAWIVNDCSWHLCK